jgi:hypothetical protein
MGKFVRRGAPFAVAAIVLALTASVASADGPGWKTVSTDFEGPLFSLNVGKDDQLLTADGVGPTKVDPDDGDTSDIAELGNVSDVIQTGRREYLALTGEGDPTDPNAASLFKIKNGNVTKIVSVLDFELANDFDESGNVPDEDSISNPFDLAKLGRNKVLVSDAGGNSIHVVDKHGNIEWVATLPYQDIDTQPIKDAAGCPTPPEGLEFLCELPPTFTVDPVATTVDVGPDGHIYAGELVGFPGPVGVSRVWRIDPDARGVRCGTEDADDDCTLVNTGPLTSIIDLKFEGKTAYVVELDEAGWFLGESELAQGGTVNACRAAGGKGNGNDNRRRNFNGDDDDDDDDDDNGSVTWNCEPIATGLPFPTAVAIEDDDVYVTLLSDPATFAFEVAKLTNGDGDEGGEDGDDEDDDDDD